LGLEYAWLGFVVMFAFGNHRKNTTLWEHRQNIIAEVLKKITFQKESLD
jgi:hypothetical protein